MPCPNGLKRVEESNILEQVGEKPETRWIGKHGNAEQYQSENAHDEKQADDTKHSHAQIPRAHSHHEWPKREHDNCEDEQQSSDGVGLLLPLRAFVQPHVVHTILCFLLLLDLDCPQTFYVFLLAVIMPLVSTFRINL